MDMTNNKKVHRTEGYIWYNKIKSTLRFCWTFVDSDIMCGDVTKVVSRVTEYSPYVINKH